jgi:class 3 adenylate cyclase
MAVGSYMGLRFIEALLLGLAIVIAFAGTLIARGAPHLLLEPIGALLFTLNMSRTEERYRRRDFVAQRRIEEERNRADRLLANTLPPPIVERLKGGAASIADACGAVTVLFADIVGFTQLSQRIPADELVTLLNQVFSAFDAIADELGLEKIKTIGDAYMLVGGAPAPRSDHATVVADAALRMREAMSAFRAHDLKIRIGLHSGPVVAGVIGRRKLAYDLWGDTVNTASRMESHGEPDAIHVTEVTAALLRDAFALDERGTIDVKGKGPMRTFWLAGRAVRAADDRRSS